MKKSYLAILSFVLTFTTSSCNNTNIDSNQISEISSTSIEDMKEKNCEVYATEYQGVSTCQDLNSYHGDVSTNLPVENGVIVSPYYSMTINDKVVPVYATRVTNTIHSFAWVDVDVTDENKDFNLEVKLNVLDQSSVLSKKKNKVDVLPLKRNVEATIDGKVISANISEYGSYSFAFNSKQDEALTLIIAEKENTEEIFKDKEISYLEPGDYSTEETRTKTLFQDTNKVYYFKSGRYKIDKIQAPADSVIYLEQGAYIDVIPTTEGNVLLSYGNKNIVVAGRGLFDYSACCGGEVELPYHANKGGLAFDSVKKMEFSGVTVINSQTWTLCLNACEDALIHDCLFLGYRTFSDGVMLSDCKNSTVYRNFIRTGDDAFETKSTSSTGLTENVWFKNNDAWTDKGVAYGCIYESNHDTSDVHFEDCTVGFAMGNWSKHLGCCVIQMGNRKGAKMYDITFNNFEIYFSQNQAIMNIYIGGSGGMGPGYGIVNNIYFSNITARRNYGAFLNLRTYDSENCLIKNVYVDNVVSNGVLLTAENYNNAPKGEIDYVIDEVVGGYNFNCLKINTLNEENN